MLHKDTQIFVSYHPNDKEAVASAYGKMKAAGWGNVVTADGAEDTKAISELIEKSGMVLVFLSKSYAQDDRLMLEEFAYAAVILRKPFLPVWLDSIGDIQTAFMEGERPREPHDDTRQLLSALEMLTAKHSGTTVEGLVDALTEFSLDQPEYKPSEPKICQAPCEAYEGNEPYIFISYAHDDAPNVYPIIEELFTAGWDLWYDEGIKPTQRYLPVIADHIKRSAVFVLMLTPRCLERPFVMNYELAFAYKRGIPVVPVLLEQGIKDILACDNKGSTSAFFNHIGVGKPPVEKLLMKAIDPKDLLPHIATYKKLSNHGTRSAFPPAIKQNKVYDVAPPPKLKDFITGTHEGGVAIISYRGQTAHIDVPGTVKIFNGEKEIEFEITHISEFAFTWCKPLVSISIPNNITSIDRYAFSGLTLLTRIALPESITSINEGIFFNCKSLTCIIPFESLFSIEDMFLCDNTLQNSITLPKRVVSIGKNAFANCTSLTRVTLPESVIRVDEHAFSGCTSLSHIVIPPNVKYIAKNAFKGCPVHIEGKESLKSVEAESYPMLPCCEEEQYALVCCAEKDLHLISSMLIALYWEGFNIRFTKNVDVQTMDGCACVLAFFTERTATSIGAMKILDYMNKRDKSRIIQLFPNGCIELPDVIKHNFQALQGIIQICSSDLKVKDAAWGRTREILREFDCCIRHPRGFEVVKIRDSTEILGFVPTGFPYVIIPKTFFNPPMPVTCISINAFKNCKLLTRVTIPEGVISIERSAFLGCTSLVNAILPEGLFYINKNAFNGCKSLISIIIPNSVTHIGECAFYGCESLTCIIIPKSVNCIEWGAFTGCESLVIYCPRDSLAWRYAEEQGMTYVALPEDSLSNINVKEDVTNIDDLAFEGYGSLISITLPKCVMSIGKRAFQRCMSLTSINLPESITSIGERAFQCCISLTQISLPESITSINSGIFGCCTSLTQISLPESITSIGDWAFWNCASVTYITLPENVTDIGKNAFNGCKSLSGIIIPKGLTSISSGTFKGCKSLASIIIPMNVTSIHDDAFKGCESLTIYCPCDSYAWRYAEKHGIKHEALPEDGK